MRCGCMGAAPLLRFEPAAVRAALVNESTGAKVLTLEPIADPIAEAGWRYPQDLVPLI